MTLTGTIFLYNLLCTIWSTIFIESPIDFRHFYSSTKKNIRLLTKKLICKRLLCEQFEPERRALIIILSHRANLYIVVIAAAALTSARQASTWMCPSSLLWLTYVPLKRESFEKLREKNKIKLKGEAFNSPDIVVVDDSDCWLFQSVSTNDAENATMWIPSWKVITTYRKKSQVPPPSIIFISFRELFFKRIMSWIVNILTHFAFLKTSIPCPQLNSQWR